MDGAPFLGQRRIAIVGHRERTILGRFLDDLLDNFSDACWTPCSTPQPSSLLDTGHVALRRRCVGRGHGRLPKTPRISGVLPSCWISRPFLHTLRNTPIALLARSCDDFVITPSKNAFTRAQPLPPVRRALRRSRFLVKAASHVSHPTRTDNAHPRPSA